MHKIQFEEDIQPLSTFRSKVAFYFDQVKKTKRPLIITQNGKSSAILLDVGEYQLMVDKIEVLEDFFSLERSYGTESETPRRVFSVIGRNTPKEIVVEGTTVAALEEVERVLFSLLPIEELKREPAVAAKLVVMDLRNGVFHPGGSSEVDAIPEDKRREYPDPWSALNDGGIPSAEFPPLETWDRSNN